MQNEQELPKAVRHELRNQLHVISNCTTALAVCGTRGERVEMLEAIIAAADGARDALRRFVDAAEESVIQPA